MHPILQIRGLGFRELTRLVQSVNNKTKIGSQVPKTQSTPISIDHDHLLKQILILPT